MLTYDMQLSEILQSELKTIKSRVYCEECKWYKKVSEWYEWLERVSYECHHPNSKKVVYSNATPIKRPSIIHTQIYENCLVKNKHNNCNHFEPKKDCCD